MKLQIKRGSYCYRGTTTQLDINGNISLTGDLLTLLEQFSFGKNAPFTPIVMPPHGIVFKANHYMGSIPLTETITLNTLPGIDLPDYQLIRGINRMVVDLNMPFKSKGNQIYDPILFPTLVDRFLNEAANFLATPPEGGYEMTEQVTPYLRGKLNLKKQLNQPRQDRFHTVTAKFTTSQEIAQLIKRVIDILYQNNLISIKSLIASKLIAALSHIQPLPEQALPELYNSQKLVVQLGLMLLGKQIPGVYGTPAAIGGFLIDIRMLFQNWVTDQIKQYFSECVVYADQPVGSILKGFPERLKPDLMIEHPKGIIIADCKWKPFTTRPSSGDLYQLFSYCSVLNSRCALLLYPESRTFLHPEQLLFFNDLPLFALPIPLSGDPLIHLKNILENVF